MSRPDIETPSSNPSNATLSQVLTKEAAQILAVAAVSVVNDLVPHVVRKVSKIADEYGVNDYLRTKLAAARKLFASDSGQIFNNTLGVDDRSIKIDFDVNKRDEDGRTALFFVSDLESLMKLINEGATFNIVDNEGKNAFEYISQHNDNKEFVDVVKMFYDMENDDVDLNRNNVRNNKKNDTTFLNFFKSTEGIFAASGMFLTLVFCKRVMNQRDEDDNEQPIFAGDELSELQIFERRIAAMIDDDEQDEEMAILEEQFPRTFAEMIRVGREEVAIMDVNEDGEADRVDEFWNERRGQRNSDEYKEDEEKEEDSALLPDNQENNQNLEPSTSFFKRGKRNKILPINYDEEEKERS